MMDSLMRTRFVVEAHELGDETVEVARTHSYEDRVFLQGKGANEAVVGELELALELGRSALERFDLGAENIERSIDEVRATTAP